MGSLTDYSSNPLHPQPSKTRYGRIEGNFKKKKSGTPAIAFISIPHRQGSSLPRPPRGAAGPLRSGGELPGRRRRRPRAHRADISSSTAVGAVAAPGSDVSEPSRHLFRRLEASSTVRWCLGVAETATPRCIGRSSAPSRGSGERALRLRICSRASLRGGVACRRWSSPASTSCCDLELRRRASPPLRRPGVRRS
jgi:hypothetical protein